MVAFMIGPPVTAYLLTDSLKNMLILSGAIGAINGILGYHIAVVFDVSIAGSIAVVIGIVFLAVFIFAPRRGLISSLFRRKYQKIEFAKTTVLFHISNHEYSNKKSDETDIENIRTHLNWSSEFINKIIKLLEHDKHVLFVDNTIKLTPEGRDAIIRKHDAIFLR